MANENNKKIPCGGFYLGDGLTMEGDTLKSLGGVTLVEVIQTGDSEYGYSGSSPIKNYEELERSIGSGLVFCTDESSAVYILNGYDGGYVFYSYIDMPASQGGNFLRLKKYIFHDDNKITNEVVDIYS